MSIDLSDVGFGDRPHSAAGAVAPMAFKRTLDLVLCLIALPFVLAFAVPVVLLIALDGHSPLFAHSRVGRNGRTFRCLKFRTMVVDAERKLPEILAKDGAIRAEWEESHKLRRDPRITKVGRFLRKTSLDELPQVWNVLRGEMSLVGPRPIVLEELALYGSAAPLYLSSRPGITGLWQISGRSDLPYGRRVALDVEYIEHWSLLLDLKILLRTAPIALGRGGAC